MSRAKNLVLVVAFFVLVFGGCGSNSAKPAWCCAELQGVCTCEPGNGSECPGLAPSCKGTYTCCGVQADDEGSTCSCASDAFLTSIGESCDAWFTSGGGAAPQLVASCPAP